MSYPQQSAQSPLILHLERIEAQWTHNHKFDSFGQLTASGHRTPHRASGIPGRTFRVKSAIAGSASSASPFILRSEKLPGLENVYPVLLTICREVALHIGASSIDGIPGTGKTDGVFKTWFGIGGLDDVVAADIARAGDCYRRGFIKAWGPTPQLTPGDDKRQPIPQPDILLAQSEFVDGHAILVSAFFKAIAATLRSGKIRLSDLLEDIKQNARLAGILDNWLARVLNPASVS